DWVELVNTGTTPVDISFWIIHSIEPGGPRDVTVPMGTTIPAGGFFVLDGFSFGSAGGGVALFEPGGSTTIFSGTWSASVATSYTRWDGQGPFVVSTTVTRGAA